MDISISATLMTQQKPNKKTNILGIRKKTVKMKRPKCNNNSNSFWPMQKANMAMHIAICSWFRCTQAPCVRLSAHTAGPALVVRVVAEMFRQNLPRLNREREFVSFICFHLDDLRENRNKMFDSGPTTAEVSHLISRTLQVNQKHSAHVNVDSIFE